MLKKLLQNSFLVIDLLVIVIDSIYKMTKNYYPLVILKVIMAAQERF